MLDPFSGWVVDPVFADRVVIPPYDVLTPEDRRRMLNANPDSYLHAILDPLDHPGPDRLRMCRAAIDRLVRDRMSTRLPDSYGVYRLTLDGQSMTGLVGLMSYEKLRWTSVLGHEQVKPERVKLLADYLSEVRASSSPAAVAVRDDADLRASLDELTARPPDLTVFPGDEGDALQEVWMVEPTTRLADLTASFDPIYIVDGHHRIAAAVAVKDVPILGVVFPASELRVEAFHRILGPLGAIERADLSGRLESAVPVPDVDDREGTEGDESIGHRPGTIVVLFEGSFYELPVRVPEVVALHEDVLPHVDPKTEPRLRFVAPGAHWEVGHDSAMFFVPPLDVDFVFDVAASGHSLPPKSTRFFPKARSGVFLSRP